MIAQAAASEGGSRRGETGKYGGGLVDASIGSRRSAARRHSVWF